MNEPLTQRTVEDILRALTNDAGRSAAVINTMWFWNSVADSNNLAFQITDAGGVHFSGKISAEWLTLTPTELMAKLIEKYPLAFAPKENQAELVAKKIEDAVKRALEAVEAARVALIELREATK
jgi:hypothetical protein